MPQYETVMFGTIEVPESEILEFRRGLLGFENLTRFVHLENNEEAPFGWLQSLDDPGTTFVVANPAVFFSDYRIELDPRELGDVKPGPNERLTVLSICTLSERLEDVTMNLQGPLIINSATRQGKQVVLNRSPFSTKHRIKDAGRRLQTHRRPTSKRGPSPKRKSDHSRVA